MHPPIQPVSDPPPRAPLDPTTLRAYEETHYRVLGPEPWTLRVREFSSALAALHRQHAVACSTFVTACNPFSQSLTDAQNVARHDALRDELQQRKLRCFEGAGQHPSNGWPPEASFLVLGLDLAAARELGIRWQQNAIIWSGADAVPRLIVLR